MRRGRAEHNKLIEHLRRSLPLTARARPPLLDYLRTQAKGVGVAPKLIVTSIFLPDEASGPVCCCRIEGADFEHMALVAPLAHLALTRRVATARDNLRRSSFGHPIS